MFRRPGFAIPLSAFCGASWMLPMPWVGPLLSLAFVGLVLAQEKALHRLAVPAGRRLRALP